MKKLAIIGAEVMAQNYAENARMMGVETHCFAWEKGAVARTAVDYFYPISIFDKERIVEVCREIGVRGVVATTELTIPIAAYVAQELGLNGIPLKVANAITDKYHNRTATRNVEGLHHPYYAHVSSVDEAFALDIPYPAIVKPIAEGGKRGITVVKNDADLVCAMEYASRESKRGYEVLVEEFLDRGMECSVESLSYHGKHQVIQVTEKISSGPPHCVELGHIQPANLTDKMRDQIQSVISKSLTTLGYTNGPCHTEIKIVDDRIYLIEFNARPGGDFITYPLVNLSTGFYHLQGAIRIALDDFEFPSQRNLQTGFAGVCFLTKQTEFLAEIFADFDNMPWCVCKNDIGHIPDLTHNDSTNMNYMIWRSDTCVPNVIRDAYARHGLL